MFRRRRLSASVGEGGAEDADPSDRADEMVFRRGDVMSDLLTEHSRSHSKTIVGLRLPRAESERLLKSCRLHH